jgi:FkbH-like protein
MDRVSPSIRLISDFNLNNLAGYLRNEVAGAAVDVSPFGQVEPLLMQARSNLWDAHCDCVVVWTQPQSLFRTFQDVLNHRPVHKESMLEEVDEFAARILHLSKRVKLICIPTWIAPGHRGLGMLDLKHNNGLSRVLMEMNLRLSERLHDAPNIFCLDAQRWINAAGRNGFSSKLWYMGKIPFGNEVFKEAALDIAACLDAIAGRAKKLLLLDLDDTLWGGVVGDIGWENLRLGGHDHIGEAYIDFQRALKALANRGVLLGIISKNEESVALEAIYCHPDMILKKEDFAGWRINWEDKAKNILDLVSELRLGLQSVVFIDDNPMERARVREALPEVLVPDWPTDCLLYAHLLRNLRCFDAPALSAEDSRRTEMYASERERANLKTTVGDMDEWLNTLEVVVTAEELNPANLTRAVQLLNKTNQMNLSTRRLSETEFSSWVQSPNRKAWTFRVRDRFGDSGLTGIVSIEIEDDRARIVDFLLSCRVMGRKVEEAMLHVAVQHATAEGASSVVAEYIPTAKNRPCLEFWQRSGFQGSDGVFHWKNEPPYPAPTCVQIEMPQLVH